MKGAREVKGTKRLESRRKPREAREPRTKQAIGASRFKKPKKTEKGNREKDVANTSKPEQIMHEEDETSKERLRILAMNL